MVNKYTVSFSVGGKNYKNNYADLNVAAEDLYGEYCNTQEPEDFLSGLTVKGAGEKEEGKGVDLKRELCFLLLFKAAMSGPAAFTFDEEGRKKLEERCKKRNALCDCLVDELAGKEGTVSDFAKFIDDLYKKVLSEDKDGNEAVALLSNISDRVILKLDAAFNKEFALFVEKGDYKNKFEEFTKNVNEKVNNSVYKKYLKKEDNVSGFIGIDPAIYNEEKLLKVYQKDHEEIVKRRDELQKSANEDFIKKLGQSIPEKSLLNMVNLHAYANVESGCVLAIGSKLYEKKENNESKIEILENNSNILKNENIIEKNENIINHEKKEEVVYENKIEKVSEKIKIFGIDIEELKKFVEKLKGYMEKLGAFIEKAVEKAGRVGLFNGPAYGRGLLLAEMLKNENKEKNHVVKQTHIGVGKVGG